MKETNIQDWIARTELEALCRNSPASILIIDVRSCEEFAAQHIPGAIHIPLDQLKNRLHELPVRIMLITTCGKGGGRSAEGAAILQQGGMPHARWLCGGTAGWFAG